MPGTPDDIIAWAWEDPKNRARTALERINQIALTAGSEDLFLAAESAANSLTRLVGTLAP